MIQLLLIERLGIVGSFASVCLDTRGGSYSPCLGCQSKPLTPVNWCLQLGGGSVFGCRVSVHIAQAPFRQLLPPFNDGESHLALCLSPWGPVNGGCVLCVVWGVWVGEVVL